MLVPIKGYRLVIGFPARIRSLNHTISSRQFPKFFHPSLTGIEKCGQNRLYSINHLVSFTMFRRAEDNYNTSIHRKTLAQQLFPSSSPTPSSSNKVNQTTLDSFTGSKLFDSSQKVPQKPLPANQTSQIRHGTLASAVSTTQSVKRTSNGLPKALDINDGFEANQENQFAPPNSKTELARLDSDNTINHTPAIESYIFSDDVFSDLDIDAEFDDHIPAKIVPTSHESDPKHLPAHQNSSNLTGLPIPPSSMSVIDFDAIPWSSSPPLHHISLAKQKLIQDLGENGPPISELANRSESIPIKRTAGNVETKCRKTPRIFPWEMDGKSNAEPPVNAALESTEAVGVTEEKYSWNTKAMSIKEQQQLVRESRGKKIISEDESRPISLKGITKSKRFSSIQKVFLSEEQQQVLNLVVEKKQSVFFTGSAGTGKSVLLREIISQLRRKFAKESDRIAITASTGLAACNIGGVTLHSFAGIGLGKEDVPELIKKIKRNLKARQRWLRTKVLIIDEISMIDGELFDKLEEVARTLRNNGKPFGGIQLIVTGDFFQLPPVPEKGNRLVKFAFDASSWNTSIDHTIALRHVFRQKDPEFARMLNEMREGRISRDTIKRFESLSRPLHFEDELQATELFSTRYEVEQANTLRMRQLQGDMMEYLSRDGGSVKDPVFRDKLLQHCIAPSVIQLKEGSQVMLIKNIDETLVNGSLGKVRGFMTTAMWDYHCERNSEDEVDEELIEKVKKAKSLFSDEGFGSQERYPLVRFTLSDGTTRDLLCQRESWKYELPNGEVQASRSQVPLILAWALSIHKAQGQTLDRVKVDLGRVFEKGQAYVALSRATTMEGLQVLRFNASRVLAHDRVTNFYAGLSHASDSVKFIDMGKVAEKVK